MASKKKLKIIPLGGLDEIGKNLTVFEYDDDIVIIDCGLAFPDEDMLGVDLVIPDISYLVRNKEKIRGIILTHGHEDHIGALPFVLKQINVPVYGTHLTIGLVEQKLKEHGILTVCKLNRIKAGQTIKFSNNFTAEFIRVNHSIVDAIAIVLHTREGVVVHTGDFKIDPTPIEGEMIDLTRFGELGKSGVLALMSDSTNVERKGYTMSESSVGERFDEIFQKTDKRIIVATFASNVHRVQQIVNSAVKAGRKIAVSGRSMLNIVDVAVSLGYMQIPPKALISIDECNNYSSDKIVLITTGSQGEPMSALSRMAYSDHRKIEITNEDLVILSASPIPGNEKTISKVIDELIKKGAEVIYESLAEVHVSGHACKEELKLILGLTKPKYFIPVHGEHRHLVHHANLGIRMGVLPKNVFVLEIGNVLEISANSARIAGNVPAGKIMVDGYGVGDVGNIVLRDRKHLAQDGLIVVVVTINDSGYILAGPDIISRGFVYVRESENLMEEARNVAKNALASAVSNHKDWALIKNGVKNSLADYLYDKTKRKPMILPVIMEV